MPGDRHEIQKAFERGIVILSLDTEQIWGYLDLMKESQFRDRYPDTPGAHDKLLTSLCAAGVSATWFVVGALALRESAGGTTSEWQVCLSFGPPGFPPATR